jgi:hypothetical protein
MSHIKFNQLRRVVYILTAGFCLIALVTGCTVYTDSLSFKISPVQTAETQYKLVYTHQEYSNQHIEFFPESSSLIINNINNVFIVNVEDGKTIKHIEVAGTGITKGRLSETGNEYFISTWNYLQIWRTSDWQLDRQLDSMAAGKISGFSPGFKYFYSGDSVWLLENAEKVMDTQWYRAPSGFAFSKDNKYLITSGLMWGTDTIDLENSAILEIKNRINAVNKIRFRSDDNFYASYDTDFSEVYYSFLASKLGLFNIKTNEVINSFNPPYSITSWCNIPQHGLVVGLLNGDILLLNDKLGITQKWHIEDNMEACSQGDNSVYWLGSKSSGVYKLDLNKMTLSHEYITKNKISDLKASPDGKYLALVESLPGESIIKLLYID